MPTPKKQGRRRGNEKNLTNTLGKISRLISLLRLELGDLIVIKQPFIASRMIGNVLE